MEDNLHRDRQRRNGGKSEPVERWLIEICVPPMRDFKVIGTDFAVNFRKERVIS